MSTPHQLRSCRRLLTTLSHRHSVSPLSRSQHALIRTTRRHASSTAPPNSPSKPIVLEQPSKFRPPSHPQRLVKGRPRPNTFGSGYNQSSTPNEKEGQKTKRYPHTFPNEGTVMHKFLSSRTIHIFITLGTLFLLACSSLLITFKSTSPYAHLIPPASQLLSNPISFFRESWAVFRLHLEYTTQQAADSRQQNILDAQKRRLYRRAHGMEDLNAEYDQGIDVRGIAPWDDGLTKRERAQGHADWERKGEDHIAGLERQARIKKMRDDREMEEAKARGEEEQLIKKRKPKLWFGIW